MTNWNSGKSEQVNGPGDDWAKLKPFKDPISGKVLPQNPQGNASPVGSDSTAKKNSDGRT